MAAGVLGRAPAGAGAAPRGARHDARLLALDRPHGAPAARRCDGWGVGPARAEAGRVAAEAGTSGQVWPVQILTGWLEAVSKPRADGSGALAARRC